jgi:hypothetical protein
MQRRKGKGRSEISRSAPMQEVGAPPSPRKEAESVSALGSQGAGVMIAAALLTLRLRSALPRRLGARCAAVLFATAYGTAASRMSTLVGRLVRNG